MNVAIVCGMAGSLFDDLSAARAVAGKDAQVIAVNFAGLYIAQAHHIVSLHPGLPGAARALRPEADWIPTGTPPPMTHSRVEWPGIDRVWELWPERKRGTSSLYAVRIAFGLAFDRVILAGVPMDGTGRLFDPPGAKVWPHEADRPAWEEAEREWFEGRVRSCSGWTQKLLGGPA